MKYLVYDTSGKILRTGNCAKRDFLLQAAAEDEFVMKGVADDITQKVVDGEIVDKTPEEIAQDTFTPAKIPEDEKPAEISKGQWKQVLKRLDDLENNA